MLTFVDQRAPKSSPPSTSIVMLPETESDRATVAELVDIVTAKRASGQERLNARSGRVSVMSLAHALHVKVNEEPGEFAKAFLGDLEREFNLNQHEILSRAFHVRFFHW